MIRRWLTACYGLYALLVLGGFTFVLMAPLMMAMPTLGLRRRVGRAGVRIGLALAGIPLRVRGTEHLPPQPCVVVSNHASYLDGPLMTAALPERFTFVVQHGARGWPWFGWVIRRMGVTFVNRTEARQGARQLRHLIRRLEDGDSLVLFAEGTFESAPGLLPFRRGAFLAAAHSGVPVVPAVIRGTRSLYGAGRRLPAWTPVEVQLFPPIAPHGDHRHATEELHDAARAVILRHCGEPDADGSDPGPG